MSRRSNEAQAALEELEAAVEDLEPERVRLLATLLEDDPESVFTAFERDGLITVSGNNRDDEDELTEAEQDALEVIQAVSNPHTASQLAELAEVEDQFADLRKERQSVTRRDWLSSTLSALVDKGEIGRYKEGREVYYTPDVADAVRNWARVNGKFVEELSADDVEQIIKDTGMDRGPINTARRELK